MDSTKILLIAQFILQIIFLGLVIFIFVREKRDKIPSEVLDRLKEIIGESKDLSSEFSSQIQEKVELISNVMKGLDARIDNAKAILNSLEEVIDKASTIRKYTKSDILKLSKGGFDPVSISQVTGIPVGEVELMLKIKEKED
ncbi:MAG: hypothetical protein J7L53_08895 [Deltaproteobacteria bacterium]|nr:hypothetical protein [Deltaproteobacteria bacterium]